MLLPLWKALADATKLQHLTILQSAFDDTTRRLIICTPIIENPRLLNRTLALGFDINHRYYLRTGLHQFCLVHHNSAVWNVLKARVDEHQVIASGGDGGPTLADTAYLMVPEIVSLSEMVEMSRSAHAYLWVVLDNLIGRDHPYSQGMVAAVLGLIEM